jgi:hypothetical protein
MTGFCDSQGKVARAVVKGCADSRKLERFAPTPWTEAPEE